jgi:hypothetical protein
VTQSPQPTLAAAQSIRRDDLARDAMVAMLRGGYSTSGLTWHIDLADDAYALADAMLTRRAGRTGQ